MKSGKIDNKKVYYNDTIIDKILEQNISSRVKNTESFFDSLKFDRMIVDYDIFVLVLVFLIFKMSKFIKIQPSYKNLINFSFTETVAFNSNQD